MTKTKKPKKECVRKYWHKKLGISVWFHKDYISIGDGKRGLYLITDKTKDHWERGLE